MLRKYKNPINQEMEVTMQFILFLYVVIKGSVTLIAELVTLGGVSRLHNAKQKYQDIYAEYDNQRQGLNYIYNENKRLLEDIGTKTKKSFEYIEKSLAAMRIHGFKAKNHRASIGRVDIETNVIQRAQKLNTWYSSFASASVGASSGSALAIGSWTLVATVGTASTGTAIGTLSGAAAFNATMAWFGGGAIAAGGAGIAGGIMVISGIVLFPLIIFWGYTIHRKAKKLEGGYKMLKLQLNDFSRKAVLGKQENEVIKDNHSKICSICDNFISSSGSLLGVLYPYGFFSRFKRKFTYLFNIGEFPKRQKEIDNFSIEMNKFLDLFEVSNINMLKNKR